MFSFVDKILEIEKQDHIHGQFHVRDSNPYLYTNKVGEQVLPACLVGEAIGQLCGWYTANFTDFQQGPLAGIVRGVQNYSLPKVNEVIDLHVAISNIDLEARHVCYSGYATIADKLLVHVEESLAPLLELSVFRNSEQVAIDFKELLEEGRQDNVEDKLIKANDALFKYDDYIIKDSKILEAMKFIPPDLSCFADHFPRKPVLPLSLLLQSNLQLGEKFLVDCYGLDQMLLKKTVINRAKISSFINPGEYLTTTCKLINENNQIYQMRITTKRQGKIIAVAKVDYFY